MSTATSVHGTQPTPSAPATPTLAHWVAGAALEGSGERFSPVTNPATGDVTAHVVLASAADANAAVAVSLPFSLTATSASDFEGYVATTEGQALEAVLLVAASLIAVWLVARRKDAAVRHAVGLRGLTRRWWIAAGVLPLLVIADRVLVPWWFGGPGVDPSVLPAQFPADGFSGIWLTANLLLIGVIAPMQEEILYRGVVYGWLRTWAGKLSAVILSAAVFAGIHAELGGMNVFVAFVFGVIAAWLYERSGSIIPAIALHAAWNTTTILLLAGIHA